jgi:hypothetical protein
MRNDSEGRRQKAEGRLQKAGLLEAESSMLRVER